jgi:2,3-dihydroxybenzoate decarboxylase
MLTMGADRILFASDYPYEDYAEAGEFMDTVAISESDRRRSLTATPRRFYKL